MLTIPQRRALQMNSLERIRKALRIFSPRLCKVSRTERIGTSLQRVRFEGEALKGLMPISPGQQISVLAEGVWPAGGRNYSISDFAPDGSWVEVIAHLHGRGPGARSFANFAIGDSTQIWGPGGGFTFPNDGLSRVYVGDESAIGTFYSMLSHEPSSRAFCAVDSAEMASAVEALQPHFRCAIRILTSTHALERDDVLLDALHDVLPQENRRFILAGRTRTLHRLRTEILRIGVPSSRISVRAFWDDRS